MRLFQWSHDLSIMETEDTMSFASELRRGFNGATIFRSWRRLASEMRRQAEAACAVSMEPRSFDHGDLTTKVIAWLRDDMGGFNGATIFRSWRRLLLASALRSMQGVVSMEPRSFDHGDKTLQW